MPEIDDKTALDNELSAEMDFDENQDKVFEELNKKLDDLYSLFIKKIERSEYEEKIVDNMHTELQKYREDLYLQLVKPVLLEIIEVRDSILRVSKDYENNSEEQVFIPIETFKSYALDMEDILEANNITVYESSEGEDFVPLRHKIIKQIYTNDMSLHRKIAQSVSCGYEYYEKVISPERVYIYIYEEKEGK